MMILYGSVMAWVRHFVACVGGCLGFCTKPTPIIAVDEPSNGLKIQGRTVKPSVSDDFWSTRTCDVDNSTVQSQRSVSSINTSNQTLTLAQCIASGCTSSQSDFTNPVLLSGTRVGSNGWEIEVMKTKVGKRRNPD